MEEPDHYILNYNLKSKFSASNFNSTGLKPSTLMQLVRKI